MTLSFSLSPRRELYRQILENVETRVFDYYHANVDAHLDVSHDTDRFLNDFPFSLSERGVIRGYICDLVDLIETNNGTFHPSINRLKLHISTPYRYLCFYLEKFGFNMRDSAENYANWLTDGKLSLERECEEKVSQELLDQTMRQLVKLTAHVSEDYVI